jgi:hypothetical protein
VVEVLELKQRIRMQQRKPKKWIDPVKGRPPRKETQNVEGNFQEFVGLMKRIVHKREEETKPSSSHAPDAS